MKVSAILHVPYLPAHNTPKATIAHYELNRTPPRPPSTTQSKIIGILWMVPIYAVDSFVSLRFKNVALYVDMLRDCYEGYALYLFLALMVGYLGDGDEYKVRPYSVVGWSEVRPSLWLSPSGVNR